MSSAQELTPATVSATAAVPSTWQQAVTEDLVCARTARGRELADDAAAAAAVRAQGGHGPAWAMLEERLVATCLARLGGDELVPLAVAEAVVWVRDQAVLNGLWDPYLGATLTGTALRRARLRLAHHRRSRRRWREVPVGDLDELDAALAGVVDHGEWVPAVLDGTKVLTDWPLAAALGAWQAGGWSLAEAAGREGVSERAAAAVLWRARRHWSRHR